MIRLAALHLTRGCKSTASSSFDGETSASWRISANNEAKEASYGLDDAEGLAERQHVATAFDEIELHQIEAALENSVTPFLSLLSLSKLEQWRYWLGWRPPPSAISAKVFRTLDLDRSGTLSTGILDVLMKYLPPEYACTKRTYDTVEV